MSSTAAPSTSLSCSTVFSWLNTNITYTETDLETDLSRVSMEMRYDNNINKNLFQCLTCHLNIVLKQIGKYANLDGAAGKLLIFYFY